MGAVDVALYRVTDRLVGEEEVDIDEERIFEVSAGVAKPATRKISLSHAS
jgi:hypothetical protein